MEAPVTARKWNRTDVNQMRGKVGYAVLGPSIQRRRLCIYKFPFHLWPLVGVGVYRRFNNNIDRIYEDAVAVARDVDKILDIRFNCEKHIASVA